MNNSKDEPTESNKSRTQSLRRSQETRNPNSDQDSDRITRSDGDSSQSQPIRISGATSERVDFGSAVSSKAGNDKKLIDQLEKFFEGYLAYVKAHEERLQTRLTANQEHQELMVSQFEEIKQSLLQLVNSNSEEE